MDSIQISIFDQAEKNNNSKIEESTIEEVVYERTRSSKNIGKKGNLANLEIVVIKHKLDKSQSICNTSYIDRKLILIWLAQIFQDRLFLT